MTTVSSIKAAIVALFLLGSTLGVYGQGTVTPTPIQTFFTNAGAPCANCLLYTYVAGSVNTDLATYSNEGLTTELPNPITLSSSGRPTTGAGAVTPIYLSQSSYKFVLTTSGGTTIWSADHVPAIPAQASALDVEGTAGENLIAGDAVYLGAGLWYKTDADVTTSSSTAGMVGVVPGNIDSGESGSIRLQGRITGLSALTAGELYYASATAGGLTATPPTNARFIAEADSTTSIVVGGNPGAVRLPDSDGTHSLVVKTTSDLTADRLFTIVPGDAARTLTMSGNASLDQNVLTTSSPTFVGLTLSGAIATPTTITMSGALSGGTTSSFSSTGTLGGHLIFSADSVIRRNTADAGDSGTVQLAGGGAAGSTRGSDILVNGNEASAAGDVLVTLGDVANANFRVSNGTDVLIINESDGSSTATSTRQTETFNFVSTDTTDSTNTQVMRISTGAVSTTTNARLIKFQGSNGTVETGTISQNNNAVAYNTTSDERLKTFLGPTRFGINTIRAINIRDFVWNNDKGQMLRTGVSAQQLYSVYPEAVSVGSVRDLSTPWSVDYGKLTPPLIAAIQDLDAVVESHDARLQQQLDLIAGIEARLRALEAENADLRARLATPPSFVSIPASAVGGSIR